MLWVFSLGGKGAELSLLSVLRLVSHIALEKYGIQKFACIKGDSLVLLSQTEQDLWEQAT